MRTRVTRLEERPLYDCEPEQRDGSGHTVTVRLEGECSSLFVPAAQLPKDVRLGDEIEVSFIIMIKKSASAKTSTGILHVGG